MNQHKLRLACADLDAGPLFRTDGAGNRYGYEPAVAAEVAARAGVTIEWSFLRWSEFIPALFDGRVDAIWCGCAITPEREREFLFSLPYASFDESVLVRRDERINTPADLSGRRIGAIADSTNMRLARQWQGCDCIGFDGTSDDVFAEMIDALRRGRIDAVVDDEPAFGGLLYDPVLRLAFTVPTGNLWGVAMRPCARQLKRQLDTALADMIADGQLRQIWECCFADIKYPERALRSGQP